MVGVLSDKIFCRIRTFLSHYYFVTIRFYFFFRSPEEKEKPVRGIGLQRKGEQVLSPRTQNLAATHDSQLQKRSPYPLRGIVSPPAPSPRYLVPNSQAEAPSYAQGVAVHPQGAAMYPKVADLDPQGVAAYPPHDSQLQNRSPFPPRGILSPPAPSPRYLVPNSQAEAPGYPQGVAVHPQGAADIYPQGAATYPQGAAMYPQAAAMYPQGPNMRFQTSTVYPQGAAMYHAGGSAYPLKGNMEMSANNFQTAKNHQQPYGMMYNNGQFVQGSKTEMLPQSGANPTAAEHTFAVPTGDYSMRPSGRQTEKDFPQKFCRDDTENYDDKQSKKKLSENVDVDDRNDSFQMEEPLSTQEQNIRVYIYSGYLSWDKF